MHKKIGKILCILPIDLYFFIFLFLFLTAAVFGGCNSLRFFSSHLSMYVKYSLLLIFYNPLTLFITLLYQKNKAMSSGFSIKFLFMEQRIFSIPCPTLLLTYKVYNTLYYSSVKCAILYCLCDLWLYSVS